MFTINWFIQFKKYVFCAVLKDAVVLHCPTDGGKPFQNTGATLEKVWSLDVLMHVVNGAHKPAELDRREWVLLTDIQEIYRTA